MRRIRAWIDWHWLGGREVARDRLLAELDVLDRREDHVVGWTGSGFSKDGPPFDTETVFKIRDAKAAVMEQIGGSAWKAEAAKLRADTAMRREWKS